MPTSANKLTRTWMGPCDIARKNSPYSYIIEFNGKRQWTHANHLRKYNERASQAVSNSCAIVFEVDNDFGDIPTLEMKVEKPNTYVMTSFLHVTATIRAIVLRVRAAVEVMITLICG
jgi:hypothetical protein